MDELVLTYVGTDFWSRPVFKDEAGHFFKDVNCGDCEVMELCTTSGFDGEPDTPIDKITRYKSAEVETVGYVRVDKELRFRYQFLSRLQADCKYYLGFGTGSEEHCLYYKDVKKQITEMKRLHDSFTKDEKPEWLTFEQIKSYEEQML